MLKDKPCFDFSHHFVYYFGARQNYAIATPYYYSEAPLYQLYCKKRHNSSILNTYPIPSIDMVGVPGKSKGCIDCKRRRVKVRKIRACKVRWTTCPRLTRPSATTPSLPASDAATQGFDARATEWQPSGLIGPLHSQK